MAHADRILGLPDGGPIPWDGSHARVADQLGLAESDVLIAELDLRQRHLDLNELHRGDSEVAPGSDCHATDQRDSGRRVKGPGSAWHLRDEFSQLASAAAAVRFALALIPNRREPFAALRAIAEVGRP